MVALVLGVGALVLTLALAALAAVLRPWSGRGRRLDARALPVWARVAARHAANAAIRARRTGTAKEITGATITIDDLAVEPAELSTVRAACGLTTSATAALAFTARERHLAAAGDAGYLLVQALRLHEYLLSEPAMPVPMWDAYLEAVAVTLHRRLCVGDRIVLTSTVMAVGASATGAADAGWTVHLHTAVVLRPVPGQASGPLLWEGDAHYRIAGSAKRTTLPPLTLAASRLPGPAAAGTVPGAGGDVARLLELLDLSPSPITLKLSRRLWPAALIATVADVQRIVQALGAAAPTAAPGLLTFHARRGASLDLDSFVAPEPIRPEDLAGLAVDDKVEVDERDADEHEDRIELDADEHDADEHDADEHDEDEHDADEHDADEHDDRVEHDADEHDDGGSPAAMLDKDGVSAFEKSADVDSAPDVAAPLVTPDSAPLVTPDAAALLVTPDAAPLVTPDAAAPLVTPDSAPLVTPDAALLESADELGLLESADEAPSPDPATDEGVTAAAKPRRRVRTNPPSTVEDAVGGGRIRRQRTTPAPPVEDAVGGGRILRQRRPPRPAAAT